MQSGGDRQSRVNRDLFLGDVFEDIIDDREGKDFREEVGAIMIGTHCHSEPWVEAIEPRMVSTERDYAVLWIDFGAIVTSTGEPGSTACVTILEAGGGVTDTVHLS